MLAVEWGSQLLWQWQITIYFQILVNIKLGKKNCFFWLFSRTRCNFIMRSLSQVSLSFNLTRSYPYLVFSVLTLSTKIRIKKGIKVLYNSFVCVVQVALSFSYLERWTSLSKDNLDWADLCFETLPHFTALTIIIILSKNKIKLIFQRASVDLYI